MDLSRLPKLSDSKAGQPPPDVQTPPADPPQVVEYHPYKQRAISVGGDIWISLIIGIVLIAMGGTFARYALAKLTHLPFHTGVDWTEGPKSGTEVDYFDLQGFTALSDMGIFFFGLTLLVEAAAKTLTLLSPGVVACSALLAAIVLTLMAVVLNIIACIKIFGAGITPLISALAVAYGGWILLDEHATLRRLMPTIEV